MCVKSYDNVLMKAWEVYLGIVRQLRSDFITLVRRYTYVCRYKRLDDFLFHFLFALQSLFKNGTADKSLLNTGYNSKILAQYIQEV